MHFGSRRTLLCALVLTGLLLMLCMLFQARSRVPFVSRLALWSLLAWSSVVSAYAFYTYLGIRTYRRVKGAPAGMSDPLTGLPNRRGLIAELERFDTPGTGFGKRAWLVDVDLLNLEKVNFEFGHMVGDAVLQDIANLLRGSVSDGALVGRLGGDEFLIILPFAEREDAEALGESIKESVAQYTLDLADRGRVGSLKANVSIGTYIPELASLHETVVTAKESTAEWRAAAEAEEEGLPCYHVPRVTLGAFAVHRWRDVGQQDQEAFKTWKRELGDELTERMANEILRLLEEKAEADWADFVTALPASGARAERRRYGGRVLAQAVARKLGLPYRDVMRGHPTGSEDRTVEPVVDAVIKEGEGVLLVVDVIGSGITERRCVKNLAASGAHVEVIAWAAY